MIIDCLIFNSELDLLELRLRELGSVVDRFVVVEAPVTFAGHPKPLRFAEERRRFSEWGHKITHVVVDDMPCGPDPWAREHHQRNALMRGLQGAQDNDAVILSDADEIPSADAVRRWRPEMGPHRFEQIFSYYWVNCVGGGWAGSRILSLKDLRAFPDAAAVRNQEFPLLADGGWHFSFIGGPEKTIAKLEAYSHQDLNQDRWKDRRYLALVMGSGIDLFRRAGMRWEFCPLDERFPSALRESPNPFSHLICDAMFHEDWYPDDQILRLAEAYESVRGLQGAILELGCWEGKSTIALANACAPESLIAIDTWAGQASEDPGHITVRLAQERDVFAQFRKNIRALTPGNVAPRRTTFQEFFLGWNAPVKFVHIDGSHDYQSVRRTIESCLLWIVPGGVLCGDDFQSACESRADLDGGVERAVRELLPGFEQVHNFWSWRRRE